MSQRDSGYARKERDLYETPAWVTEALLPHVVNRIDAMIWEPAAGSGKMANVLSRIARVYQSDIYPNPSVETFDFLETKKDDFDFDAIITNPPYELAVLFIAHALHMTRPRGIVAMLLRTDFDYAKTRKAIFGDCPHFAKKLVLTKRIKWFEDSTGSPSFNHAWFIWDFKHHGDPTIAYAHGY